MQTTHTLTAKAKPAATKKPKAEARKKATDGNYKKGNPLKLVPGDKVKFVPHGETQSITGILKHIRKSRRYEGRMFGIVDVHNSRFNPYLDQLTKA